MTCYHKLSAYFQQCLVPWLVQTAFLIKLKWKVWCTEVGVHVAQALSENREQFFFFSSFQKGQLESGPNLRSLWLMEVTFIWHKVAGKCTARDPLSMFFSGIVHPYPLTDGHLCISFHVNCLSTAGCHIGHMRRPMDTANECISMLLADVLVLLYFL